MTDERTMSFKEFCAVVDFQQKMKARQNRCVKKILTFKEKCNRFAQMGKVLGYKGYTFTFDDGFGVLRRPNGTGCMGATISDFEAEVYKAYGKKLFDRQ